MSNKTFTIKLEFTDVIAENPLEAAKIILSWIKDGAEDMTYDVKDETTEESFTVDLSEEDEDAVLLNENADRDFVEANLEKFKIIAEELKKEKENK